MNQTLLVGKVLQINKEVGDETRLTLEVERSMDDKTIDELEVVAYDLGIKDKIDNALGVGNLVGCKCRTIRANGGEQVSELVILTILGA